MDPNKLHDVIQWKNDQTERNALRQAEVIIEEIVRLQSTITSSNNRIIELRKELVELTVETIDPKTVLG